MESAITSKGQATIPKAIRQHLRLMPGDRVKFFIHPDGSVVLLPKLPASALRGIIRLGSARDGRGNDRGRSGGRRRRHAAPQTAMIGLDTNALVRYSRKTIPCNRARRRN